MAEAKLQFLLDLEDRVSPGMQKLQTNLDNFKGKVEDMKPAFQTMAKVGVAGLAAITGAVIGSVKSYGEAERSQRQLEHAVIGVSKGTMEQVEAVTKLSDALQAKSGIDGDALKMGVAQLSTFGLQSKSVVDLTKSLADLTVNQDGVNASADQYVNNANIMAKALNGQFGILEKSGIRFTEAQQNMILYGKESEKVSALQAGLAQNLRETTDTLDGVDASTARATRSMGEVFESIGKSFAPMVAKLSDAVTPLINSLNNWIQNNPKLASTVLMVGAGLFALLATVGTLGLILPAIITGFTALAGAASFLGGALLAITWPIALIIAGIVALIAVGVLIYKNWEEISAFAGRVWDGITSAVTNAMTAISNTLSAIWEGIKNVFIGATNFIIGVWATLLDFLFPGWEESLMNIWNKAVEIWTAITGALTVAWEAIKTVFNTLLDGFMTKWTDIWTAVKDVFSSIWESIASVFDSVVEGISNAMTKLISPIQKVIDLATRALSLAGGAIKSTGGSISSGIKSIIERGKSLTGLATGGSVYGGTPYMVGEKGPELFVPGASGRIVPNHALAGGNGGVNIYLTQTGNTFLDRNSMQAMGKEMLKLLKDNMRV